MSFAIPVFIILLAVAILAGLIIFTCVRAYNKRLDRITKGEVHGTHSRIPDPSAVTTAVFRIIITVVVFISFIFISSIYGRVYSLPDRLESEMHSLNIRISELNDKVEKIGRNGSETSYEIKDISGNRVKLRYEAELRSFSDDTQVTLRLNGADYPMKQDSAGIFGAEFETDLFAHYSESQILIRENGRTTVEETGFPEELFWDVLPLPQLTNTVREDSSFFSPKYSGEYILTVNDPSGIKTAAVTNIIDGKETGSFDALDKIVNGLPISYSDIPDGKDFVIRIVIGTESGYVITYVMPLFTAGEASETLKIEDQQGGLLYKLEK